MQLAPCVCSCHLSIRPFGPLGAPGAPQRFRVEVRQEAGQWKLLRDGKAYFIRGAGGQPGHSRCLRAAGGKLRTNVGDRQARRPSSIRLRKLGLDGHGRDLARPCPQAGFQNTMMPGRWRRQAEQARQAILKYKDHPAVLMWGLGNEMETEGNEDNSAMWGAVNDLAAMAHKLDPSHPTMTVVAENRWQKR